MGHVKEIREFLKANEEEKAIEAISSLLSLGPHNLEALKLKALIFEKQGRFAEEEKIWRQIIGNDPEDTDALNYLYNRHLEEREFFYFTDNLPEGRRYIAYPKALMSSSILGLLGCALFLSFSQMGQKYPLINHAYVTLPLFAILVVIPWVNIGVHFIKSLKYIALSHQGILFSSRLRTIQFLWKNLTLFALVYDSEDPEYGLRLILIPEKGVGISLNLREGESAVRARSYFLAEAGRYHEITHLKLSELKAQGLPQLLEL